MLTVVIKMPDILRTYLVGSVPTCPILMCSELKVLEQTYIGIKKGRYRTKIGKTCAAFT